MRSPKRLAHNQNYFAVRFLISLFPSIAVARTIPFGLSKLPLGRKHQMSDRGPLWPSFSYAAFMQFNLGLLLAIPSTLFSRGAMELNKS